MSHVSYSQLAAALTQTALDTLPPRQRPSPGWFGIRADVIRARIRERNAAFDEQQQRPSSQSLARLRRARAAVKVSVTEAKSEWILAQCAVLNDGILGKCGTKPAWDVVEVLRAGLHGVQRRPAPAKMRKPDGSLATSPEESAEVFAIHFEQLYGRRPVYDETVLALLPQRDVVPGLSHPFTDD